MPLALGGAGEDAPGAVRRSVDRRRRPRLGVRLVPQRSSGRTPVGRRAGGVGDRSGRARDSRPASGAGARRRRVRRAREVDRPQARRDGRRGCPGGTRRADQGQPGRPERARDRVLLRRRLHGARTPRPPAGLRRESASPAATSRSSPRAAARPAGGGFRRDRRRRRPAPRRAARARCRCPRSRRADARPRP